MLDHPDSTRRSEWDIRVFLPIPIQSPIKAFIYPGLLFLFLIICEGYFANGYAAASSVMYQNAPQNSYQQPQSRQSNYPSQPPPILSYYKPAQEPYGPAPAPYQAEPVRFEPPMQYQQPVYQAPKYEPQYQPPQPYQAPQYEPYQQSYQSSNYETYQQPYQAPQSPRNEPYQQSYQSPKHESYPPPKYESYQQTPAHESYQSPKPPQAYQTPQYEPYQQPYQQSYQPPQYESYQPPQYEPYQSYQPEYSQNYQESQEYYEVRYPAITYQELNTSTHCGVIPDTNFELYRKGSDAYEVADIAPFGKFPWIVLILYNNKVICQGTLIHYNFIITSSNCINKYNSLEKYELRVGDWDILTDYNEYEAYSDREIRICSTHELPSYSSYGKYDSDDTGLTILKSDYEPNYDRYPHVKPLCLPKLYTPYSPSYANAEQYLPYAVCWVAGWYGSEITKLENHPLPQMADEEYEEAYGSHSHGHRKHSKYFQNYYKDVDYSMIQKRAKVEQVDCPSYIGYGSSSSSVCFIGVDGYDACVAEQGSAIFCIVQEPQDYGEYNSGVYQSPQQQQQNNYGGSYNSGNSYDNSYDPVSSSIHPEYASAHTYYKKPIQAIASPSKPNRYRAVLYAIIQKAAKCRKGIDNYGKVYYRKSRPLVATRVDHTSVSGILDAMWGFGYDHSCPVTKAKYKGVKKHSYQQQHHSRYGSGKSNSYHYYFGNYRHSSKGKGGYSYGHNKKNY